MTVRSIRILNAYLDVTVDQCASNSCTDDAVPGLRKATGAIGLTRYMPNAAIGWKQPNGFYYPPALYSKNLDFNNVDIRHFVIEPLFQPGTYVNAPLATLQTQYCGRSRPCCSTATRTSIGRPNSATMTARSPG